MKKILITGISGFVGGHFCEYLTKHPARYEIYGISRSPPSWDFVTKDVFNHVHFEKSDLMDISKIKAIVNDIEPDYIMHLAAQSSVAESWKSPVSSFINNTNIFLNVLDIVRQADFPCKILSIGSSEQYGIVGEDDLPLNEERPLRPANPYAVARVAQELLARVYIDGYGMNICCTRSFNHCGPGQSDTFVVSSIVKQFVKVMRGEQDPIINIGNGAVIRDFLDIHDVISAYLLILENGRSGEVYNVCSGKGHSIRDIVTLLSDIYRLPIEIKEDRSQFRPVDNPRIIGSYQKINNDLNWAPVIPLEASIQSIYRYWWDHFRDN